MIVLRRPINSWFTVRVRVSVPRGEQMDRDEAEDGGSEDMVSLGGIGSE